MALEHNVGHVLAALKKLAAPFWGKPRIASFVYAVVRQVQEIEDVAHDIIDAWMIDNATGPRLTSIGQFVGQENTGAWDEDTYRLYIKARIRINRSEGTRKDVWDVTQLLGVRAKITPVYPAANRIDLLDNPEQSATIAVLLGDTVGAGIGAMTISGATEEERFWWPTAGDSDGPAWGTESDPGSGAASVYVIEA